ncbi:hypothetical protein CVT25_008146 [Psilocybe cyanescens]|uniref:cellulase n=1 Tax=Psilocybe cyanescens TaxID=93625 RepID=A0A409XSV5_PSICY|nr:hypothetical protein CVT25_008146 [Psilocybe cyanescens]
MTLLSIALLLGVGLSASAQSPLYGQYYSQCLPGSASQSSSTVKPTTGPSSTVSTTAPSPTCSSSLVNRSIGKLSLVGVNIAGFDFGCGTDGTCDVTKAVPPLQQYSGIDGQGQMQHFVNNDGFNIFRLPVGWQFLTGSANSGTLNQANFAKYDALVQACLGTGASCIIDIHNYARFNGQIVGQGGPSNDVFASLWSNIASKYASNSKVIFGIMNEPHDVPDINAWATSVQAAVTAIRKAGATSQRILLPGNNWTSAETFVSNGSGPALAKVVNLDGSTTNLIFDVHKYLDSDNSGTHADCVTNNIQSSWAPLANWLRCNGRQALNTETGGGNTASCIQFACEQIAFQAQNSDVILGYVGWSAGAFAAAEVPTKNGNAWTDTSLVQSCLMLGLGAVSVQAQAPLYGQWLGGRNDLRLWVFLYYSQCLPGVASSSSSATASKPSATPSTTSKPASTSAPATSTSAPSPTCSASLTSRATGKLSHVGINIAGFDFGCNSDGDCTASGAWPPLLKYYGHDGEGQMNHFVNDDGFNTFRLPVGWQFLTNNAMSGTINQTNLAIYDDLVQACLATGASCIVDVHNYARFNGEIIGQGGPSNDIFAALWTGLATKYASTPNVIFGVMNEPHDVPDINLWAQSVQAAVTAIRKAGATTQLILLPGNNWTSAQTFVSNGSGDALMKVVNPDGTTTGLIFDVHKYLDSDNSGTNSECVTNNIEEAWAPLANWLRCNGRQAFNTETGGGNTASCIQYLCQQIAFQAQNSDVFLGYVGWAAGNFDPSKFFLTVHGSIPAFEESMRMGDADTIRLNVDRHLACQVVSGTIFWFPERAYFVEFSGKRTKYSRTCHNPYPLRE